jgi:hypothetical protein
MPLATHFVAAMGTTGTIMGVSETLKKHNQAIQIIGVQPEDGAKIAGIRRWPKAYLPKIFDATKVDAIMDVSQTAAEQTSCLPLPSFSMVLAKSRAPSIPVASLTKINSAPYATKFNQLCRKK